MPKMSNLEYPDNLLNDILNYVLTLDPIDPVPDDFMGSLAYVLWTLNNQERVAIHLRYEEKMTYKDIGKVMDLSNERVRQILAKALRKLRYPTRLQYLRYGVSGVMSRKVKNACDAVIEEYKKSLENEGRNPSLNLRIEDLGLAVRSYNALRRGGILTVEDIVNTGYDEISKIRNCGRRSMDDIVRCLRDVGVEF